MFGYFDDPVPDRTHVETGSTEGIGGQDPPPEDERVVGEESRGGRIMAASDVILDVMQVRMSGSLLYSSNKY